MSDISTPTRSSLTPRRTAALNESPHLAPISRPAITDEIVNRLVSLILEEGLKPGDRLPSEHHLMTLLAVGRSSLREAVKTLRAIGVVDVVNGNGMYVGQGGASLSSKPLSWGLLMRESGAHELIDARRLVESELAALAAQRATAEEIVTLGRLAGTPAPASDPETVSAAAVDFHLAVAHAAHHTVLSYFFEGLQHILRVWIINTYSPEETSREPDEHVPIYEAIKARDTAGAREAMATHLDAAGARLLRFLNRTESTESGGPPPMRVSWAWSGTDST